MEGTLNIQNQISGIERINVHNLFSLAYSEVYREKVNNEIIKSERVFEDLQILHLQNRSPIDYKFTIPQTKDTIIFHYQFSGKVEVSGYFGKLLLKSDEQNIYFSENKNISFALDADSECCLLITTNENTMSYFTNMENSWASHFEKEGRLPFHAHLLPITFSMRNCIEEMFHSGREGFLLKLHLESLMLKLVMLHFEQIENHDCKVFCSLKKVEYKRMHEVRKIITDNLNQWYTISELACKTGTNECSLKKGFKEVFGIPVFEFVKKSKMDKAYSLLRNTEHNISTIGEKLGYKNHTHFSAAFKKNFGITPKGIRQLS